MVGITQRMSRCIGPQGHRMRQGCKTVPTLASLRAAAPRIVCGWAQADLERLWEEQQYYKKAVSYWDMQPADVDGVLGGFGHVSAADIRDSKRLLQKACFESQLVLGGDGCNRKSDPDESTCLTSRC